MKIVFVTCPPGRGAEILKPLVEERLVAGGNIIPGVLSIYWWQDKVCEEPEEILLMETSDSRVEAMMARIKELHPYEVPKILTFEPGEGLPDYLAWVATETRS
jgi:periplasmic divalent cation tolerance protein